MTARGEGLGRAARIRSRRDFEAIYADRRSIRNRSLTFVWRLATTGRSRLGLSVGRRVGDAVRRNRVKRILREVFRREAAGFPRPLDIIVVPRDFRSCRDFEETRASFRHLMRKLERQLEAGETQ